MQTRNGQKASHGLDLITYGRIRRPVKVDEDGGEYDEGTLEQYQASRLAKGLSIISAYTRKVVPRLTGHREEVPDDQVSAASMVAMPCMLVILNS